MNQPDSKWGALWAEIRRRKVGQVTLAYVVAALAFLQGADVMLPSLTSSADAVMQVLVIMSIVGLPAVITLAWVYDLTPWGVQRTLPMPVPEGAALPEPAARSAAPEGPATVGSIAVLPFVDASAAGDQEHLADGVADAVINQLTQRTDLRVAARTSSFAYRGLQQDIREIGRELGVDAVLEGSVRKSGDRLRVTAQLVAVRDGYNMWSERYERETADVFQIEDDIAISVIERLDAPRRPDISADTVGPGTDDPEAYELYLKGQHLWVRRYKIGLQHALQYFQRAVERDPAFALPYAGIADCYTVFGIYSFMPGAEAAAMALESARRAVELGPEQARAHVALGRARCFFDWDWDGAEQSHQTALALDPTDGRIMASAAQLSLFRGRKSEAEERAQKALELAPDSSFAGALIGAVFLYTGNVDGAIEHLRGRREKDPEHTPMLYVLSEALMEQGDVAAALPLSEEAVTLTHRALPFVALLGSAYARAGREEDARALLKELEDRGATEFVTPITRSMVHAGLGELDRAFELFFEGLDLSAATVTQTIRDPIWNALRRDERWNQVLDRMGLPKLT